VEGFFRAIRYSSQPISQRVTLLFSLLKRKKEAKKEKSSRYTCTTLQTHHTKITQEIFINKNPPAG
jgi:hypothetical protein